MGEIKKILGDNIRQLRNSKGWTQVYLADRLEITSSFLTMVESGQRGVSLELVERIANEFDIPVALLFVEQTNIKTKKTESDFFRKAEIDLIQKNLTTQICDIIKKTMEGLRK